MTDDALLHDELMMLPDYFSSINKEKKLGLKKITKISTVCQLLNAQQIGKTMFYEYKGETADFRDCQSMKNPKKIPNPPTISSSK